jgi:lysozyme family protein
VSFFDQAFVIVVGIEAGYVNDPQDPGGETKYGISKRSYPNLDIAHLTLDQAKAIYFEDYWTPAGCDSMRWELALCVFDAAVNQGQNYAKLLPSDPVEIMAQRALRYARNPNLPNYGHGWFRRLFTVFKKAQVTPS